MANPSTVACPAGQWTKVATNVNSGVLWKKSSKPFGYWYTYRETGQAAPTLFSEGVPIFRGPNKDSEIINASAIDIYIWAKALAGSVRVDV